MTPVSRRHVLTGHLLGLLAFALAASPSCAQEKYFGDAERLTRLLGEKATVVGYSGNTILLLKGTTLYRCEIAEILKLGDALKASDGTKLYRYKSRGCGKIYEEE